MNYIDFICFGILLIGALLGFKDGLVRKAIGLIGFVFAIFFVLEFSNPLGIILTPFFNNEFYLAEIISGVFIFFASILIVAFLKRIIHPMEKVNKLLNQILGAVAGFFQTIILLSFFLLFFNIVGFPAETTKETSLVYKPIFKIIPESAKLLLGENSHTNYYLDEIINRNNFTDSLKIDDNNLIDTMFNKTDSLKNDK